MIKYRHPKTKELLKPSSTTLLAHECYGTTINNYGQTDNVELTLPPAANGMRFKVVISSSSGKLYKLKPVAPNQISLGGNTGTNVGMVSAIKSDRLVIESFMTGTNQWNWLASSYSKNWTLDAYGWSTTSSLNVARYSLAGCGSTSAALSFGGYTGDYANTTEKWL